jgi:predicted acyltransferase
MILLGVIMLIFGFGTRPLWGISKIRATPAWVGICTGISFLIFGFLYVLVDVINKKSWFRIIDAAGTSTLTCYLIPYYWYAIIALLGFSLPIALRTGGIGIIKSIIFALIIVQITGLLEKLKIKLRI